MDEMKLFCLSTSRKFGEKIAGELGEELSEHEERDFEDGEHKIRPLESVRGKDVYVVQSLYGGPDMNLNEKLCRLLFFIGALKDAAADRVTAVVPYLCYSRKDRKTKSRDPITTKYVASLFEAVGTDRIVTIDVHNLQAYQNSFRNCRTEHLEAKTVLAGHFRELQDRPLVIVSPDIGGIKRAESFRKAIKNQLAEEPGLAFMEKHRSWGEISGSPEIFGDVKDKNVIIIDDLISSGGTLIRAAEACKNAGAKQVYTAATHGAFSPKAKQLFFTDAIDKVVITDTIPPFRFDKKVTGEKLYVISCASLFAEAIKRMHGQESLVELVQ